MTDQLSFVQIFRETIAGARRVVVPSLPWLFLFAFAAGYRDWSGVAMPDTQAFLLLDLLILLGVIYAGCLFSAVMYKQLLPEATWPLRALALRLGLANLSLYMATIIIVFILALFLSIFSGVMVGLSDYDPSNTDPTDITQSLAALYESGAIWPLYILLFAAIAGLCWFAVRMILFGAGTAVQGQVIVFQSWGWTKTHVAKITGLVFVLQVAVFIVFFVCAEWLTQAIGYPSTTVITLTQESTLSLDFGDPDDVGISALQYGIGTAIRVLILAPFWWLGHALAAALYKRLAPVDQATTPASSS